MQRALLLVYELILKQGEWPASEKPKPVGISAFLKLNPELKPSLKVWAYLQKNLEEIFKFFFFPQLLNILIIICSAKQTFLIPHSTIHSWFCRRLPRRHSDFHSIGKYHHHDASYGSS